jgi:hypothetical protein
LDKRTIPPRGEVLRLPVGVELEADYADFPAIQAIIKWFGVELSAEGSSHSANREDKRKN